MNTEKCGTCKNFDQRTTARKQGQPFGWCAKRSVYPAKEGPGQKAFPAGVARVKDPFKPAKPLIVWQDTVDIGCAFFTKGV